ncbi:MAG: SUMF1/EgtB/PvdO family nonheme iron enzyme [Kiritimatiellae bacterium]|nr:SUMF1/EgtB/PvdO family nonheme iron enzyme [Kiritimatiellia bacterium]
MKMMIVYGLLFALMAGADPVATQVAPGAVPEITWTTRPMGVYSLYRSEHAEGPFDTQVGTNVTATGSSLSLADTAAAPAGSKRYYRVKTETPGYPDYLIIDVSGGTNAVSWPITGTNAVPDLLANPAYRTTKVVMRMIKAGSFKMLGTYDVTLTRPYYIGVFEVTQAQYTNMTGVANFAQYPGPTRPMDSMKYSMVRGGTADGAGYGWPTNNLVASNSVIGLLRAKTGSDNFDLPTSAQWEYASRAGTTTHFYNGTDANPANASDFSMLTNIARCLANRNISIGGYTGAHAPVGSYQPNAWGLYDTHGNVAELMLDWLYSVPSPLVDPVGPNTGTQRLFRGGQSGTPTTDQLKNTVTSSYSPDALILAGVMGFRLALRLPEGETVPLQGGPELPAITQVVPKAAPIISWPTRAGGVYGLFRSADPYGPFETQVGTNLVADGTLLSLADGGAAGGKYYYKVEELAPGYARYMIVDVSGGTNAAAWPVAYTNVIPDLLTDESHKTNKIVLKLLPAATFTMGVPVKAGVPVTLTRPFYASVFEVTQAQYTKATGQAKGMTGLPADTSYNNIRGSTNAADGVNWPVTTNKVAPGSFMGMLRAKTATEADVLDFDLPTDAQWEYACRAGTTSHFNNGRNAASANDWGAVNELARTMSNGSGKATVGSYLPNGFGLYDLHGNVAEWCLDWSWDGPAAYAVDPAGPGSGSYRLLRGGSHTSPATDFLYSAGRVKTFRPEQNEGNIGFRLVCRLPE